MLRRAGLIIPSSNRMVEQEMVRYYPDDVGVHVTRLRMTGPNRMPLDKLLPAITEATAALADAKCEVISFHCTANSTEDGVEGERKILAAMSAAGTAKVSSTATALRRALTALDARRVVLVTPYTQAVTDHETLYLAAVGARVIRAIGHDLAGSDAYCAAPAQYWIEAGLAARHPDADASFLSCANIAAFGAVAALEDKLGKPVITSNQIVIWDQLRLLGIAGAGRCPGQLMKR